LWLPPHFSTVCQSSSTSILFLSIQSSVVWSPAQSTMRKRSHWPDPPGRTRITSPIISQSRTATYPSTPGNSMGNLRATLRDCRTFTTDCILPGAYCDAHPLTMSIAAAVHSRIMSPARSMVDWASSASTTCTMACDCDTSSVQPASCIPTVRRTQLAMDTRAASYQASTP
jgi:hypothetical protein